MNRREERENVFQLLFETEFHHDMTPSAVYMQATEARQIPDTVYIHDTYFGTLEMRDESDALIAQNAKKWKLSRMAVVTRTILRLAVYEMLWGKVPPKAAINEAIELAKIYDDEAAPAFVNGILNQIAHAQGAFPLTESVASEDVE